MLELNKIYNMDCLEGLKLLDDNSIDLIVTSPPYNIGIDYSNYSDLLSWEEYLNWVENWLIECYRVLKPDGRICLNHYINFRDKENNSRFPIMDIRTIQEKIGFNVHKLIIWEDITRSKSTAWGSWLSASAPYVNTPYESILISYKKNWKKEKRGVSTIRKDEFLEGISGVWKIGTTKSLTKACFPIKLPEMCIKMFSFKDDTVVDCFMGSGTTAVACVKNNRNYIGFEISKEYCEIAKERLNTLL